MPVLRIVAITGALNVLLLNVSVVDRPTNVSVASGKVMVRFAVWDPASVKIVLLPAALVTKPNFFVLSIGSAKKFVVVKSVLFNIISVVFLATNVSIVFDGKVSVPVPLTMDAMIGALNVLFDNVSVVERPTNVSFASGK